MDNINEIFLFIVLLILCFSIVALVFMNEKDQKKKSLLEKTSSRHKKNIIASEKTTPASDDLEQGRKINSYYSELIDFYNSIEKELIIVDKLSPHAFTVFDSQRLSYYDYLTEFITAFALKNGVLIRVLQVPLSIEDASQISSSPKIRSTAIRKAILGLHPLKIQHISEAFDMLGDNFRLHITGLFKEEGIVAGDNKKIGIVYKAVSGKNPSSFIKIHAINNKSTNIIKKLRSFYDDIEPIRIEEFRDVLNNLIAEKKEDFYNLKTQYNSTENSNQQNINKLNTIKFNYYVTNEQLLKTQFKLTQKISRTRSAIRDLERKSSVLNRQLNDEIQNLYPLEEVSSDALNNYRNLINIIDHK